MNVLKAAANSIGRTAIRSARHEYKYEDILHQALKAAAEISSSPETTKFPTGKARGPRIAILAPPGRIYVESTLGTWLAGGIAVPLSLSHPQEQLQYILKDAQVSVVLVAPAHKDAVASVAASAGARLLCMEEEPQSQGTADVAAQVEGLIREVDPETGSLIIYTSGTTGPPKGALHSHRSLHAQIAGLCSAWKWQADDIILHALPLHHIHGIVNALYCPLAAGACVEFLPRFSPTEVWKHLQRVEDPVTVFMGVPTMYSYLLSAYDQMGEQGQCTVRKAASRLRLTVSGSAACPVPLMKRWEALSGQKPLERYGMTETGMLLSNPYCGERRPGFVGLPLPGVDVKSKPDGELAVQGDNLFTEYYNRPEATATAFDADGFFLTGDTGLQEGNPPYWRILGRTSVDIIKSAGYKVSALQVEDAVLSHPAVSHCAVLGVADDELGEAIVAIISCHAEVSEDELLEHAGLQLPSYQVPKRVVFVDEIPRNAMGKINKKNLRQRYFPEHS